MMYSGRQEHVVAILDLYPVWDDLKEVVEAAMEQVDDGVITEVDTLIPPYELRELLILTLFATLNEIHVPPVVIFKPMVSVYLLTYLNDVPRLKEFLQNLCPPIIRFLSVTQLELVNQHVVIRGKEFSNLMEYM